MTDSIPRDLLGVFDTGILSASLPRFLILYILVGNLLTDPVRADTAVLIEGVSDGRGVNAGYVMDACTLESGAVSLSPGMDPPEAGNWGRSGYLMAGRGGDRLYRSLIRFDLSALADGALTVQQARLVLTFFKMNEFSMREPVPESVELCLFKVDPSNAGWREGESATGERIEGAACWRERVTGTEPWAGESGLGLAGVDRDEEPLATVTLSKATLARGDEIVFEFSGAAFLEEWIRDSSSNAGFLLQSPQLEEVLSNRDMGMLVFDSDDAVDLQARPRLVVDYVKETNSSADPAWTLLE